MCVWCVVKCVCVCVCVIHQACDVNLFVRGKPGQEVMKGNES